MGRMVVRLNQSGMRAAMKSQRVQYVLHGVAEDIAAKANNACSDDNMRTKPYMVYDRIGEVSAHSFVFTATPHGRLHEAKHHTLANLSNDNN